MRTPLLVTALACPLLTSAAATAQPSPPPPPLPPPVFYASTAPGLASGCAAPTAYGYPCPPPQKRPPESVPAIIVGSSVAGAGVVALVSSLVVVVAGTRCDNTGLLQLHCGDTQTARDVAGALALGGLGAVAVGVPLIVYGAQRKPAATVRVGPGGLALAGTF